jgi:hypothetical protein
MQLCRESEESEPTGTTNHHAAAEIEVSAGK